MSERRVEGTDPTPATRAGQLLDAVFRPSFRSTRDALIAVVTLGLPLLVALVVLARVVARVGGVVLDPTDEYVRDFVQEYLLARSALAGADPYGVPMAELARTYLPAAVEKALPNPIPHPPTLVAFILPLGFLPYSTAATIWLGVEVLCALAIGVLIGGDGLRRFRPRSAAFWLVPALLLVWGPVAAEFELGQVMTLEAALVVGCWYAHRAGRDRFAGVLLGLAASVKLYPALLLLYFAIRRRWGAVGAALVTLAATGGVAVLALGPTALVSYVTFALPQTSAVVLFEVVNSSLAGLVNRSLVGASAVEPLVAAPGLAGPLVVALSLVVVALASRDAWRARDERGREAAFARLVAAFVLIGPVTWNHYYVLLAWPISVLGGRLARRGWPSGATIVLLAAIGLLSIATSQLRGVAYLVGSLTAATGAERYPAVVGLPFVLPTLGLVALFFLLRAEPSECAPGD